MIDIHMVILSSLELNHDEKRDLTFTGFLGTVYIREGELYIEFTNNTSMLHSSYTKRSSIKGTTTRPTMADSSGHTRNKD